MSERRAGRIPLSLDMLRLVLDLPAWARIEAVTQFPGDGERRLCSVVVSGPYFPEIEPDHVPPTVDAVWDQVHPTQARLKSLHGLDT